MRIPCERGGEGAASKLLNAEEQPAEVVMAEHCLPPTKNLWSVSV